MQLDPSSSSRPDVLIPKPGVLAWNAAAVLGLVLLALAVTTWDTRLDPVDRVDHAGLALAWP